MDIQPQIVKNFPFRGEVERIIRTKADRKRLIQAAERIFRAYIGKKHFQDALETYFNVCCTIDGIKIKTAGSAASTEISNLLMRILGELFAGNIQAEDKDTQALKRIASGLKVRPSEDALSWLYPKAKLLEDVYFDKHNLERFIESLSFQGNPEAVEKMLGELPDIQAVLREGMEELLRLRRYGIKFSFFQDGMLHRPDQAWVFADFREVAPHLPSALRDNHALALVTLAERKSIRELRFYDAKEEKAGWRIHGLRFSFNKFFNLTMDRSAELDLSAMGTGALLARPIFAAAGKEIFYEMLRFANFMRLYDLIVPLETVAATAALPSGGGRIKQILNLIKREKIVTPDLLLPRLRKLESPQELIPQLEREVEEADKETQRRARESMRQHEVVEHIRRLPKGYRPTAHAKKLAAETFGIELQENETFVRKHERGKGETVGAHRAKHRNSK